ncbi:pyroglutamyl-peptidase I [Alkaliphilus serpentinus]|uniref:Pyrrolidone-carboxylate peptidase n=1 Tax=Alkaliphilus serpentinus TaxID=1482731 RepID=A0A833HN74_9FIRM|nr:pyroglutamyl-peptidase I [Alkaliphilus serpentinus]KAB3529263.1 pyroglutamyl-peptidase I [Alkaliphilus serpentinus]
MKVLVTGFDPFGGEALNPATEVLKLLPDKLEDIEIVKQQIPTVFYSSLKVIYEKISEIKPDIVIAIGQAGGRKEISIERVAININDARIPDNEGNQPIDEAIYKEGPVAYFSTLPIKAIVHEISQHNILATVSNTAGTFVCNHLMYGLLHHIATEKLPIKGGFIHIPFIPQQVINKEGMPAMELKAIAKGITLAISAACHYSKGDLKIEGGKLD